MKERAIWFIRVDTELDKPAKARARDEFLSFNQYVSDLVRKDVQKARERKARQSNPNKHK